MEQPIRVFIVDDQQMFREGVRRRLEQEPDICIIGEAASGKEALAQVQKTNPTIVILDIRLPDISGIEVARRIRDQWPELKILMLSGYDLDQYISAAARVGIQGYLLKDAPQDSLVQAIRDIMAGGAVLPPRVASKVMHHYATNVRSDIPGELTMRELDVLELMHQGLRNQEIAEHLSLSTRTIEVHVGNIIEKLGADSRTEAVRIAIEKDMIK
jgi:DNA-binding NarL/FixJ family response regulator